MNLLEVLLGPLIDEALLIDVIEIQLDGGQLDPELGCLSVFLQTQCALFVLVV